MPEKPRIGLFHSELVKMGQVKVTVKAEPARSKYPDKPNYVFLIIDGVDRRYDCENDGCEEFFKGQAGRTMLIAAEGKKHEAIINFIADVAPDNEPAEQEERGNRRPADGARPPARSAGKPAARATNQPKRNAAPATQTPPARRETAPPANKPPTQSRQPLSKEEREKLDAEHVIKTKLHAAKVSNVWMISYAASKHAVAQIKEQFGDELSDEQFKALVATVCIQLHKDGYHTHMPAHPIHLVKQSTDAAK